MNSDDLTPSPGDYYRVVYTGKLYDIRDFWITDISIREMVVTNQFNINEKNPLIWFIERMM